MKSPPFCFCALYPVFENKLLRLSFIPNFRLLFRSSCSSKTLAVRFAADAFLIPEGTVEGPLFDFGVAAPFPFSCIRAWVLSVTPFSFDRGWLLSGEFPFPLSKDSADSDSVACFLFFFPPSNPFHIMVLATSCNLWYNFSLIYIF